MLSQVCYDGPAASANVGPCREGARVCDGGVLGACEGQVLPGLEICDGVDNDCNQAVDDVPGLEECVCEPGDQQDCYTGPDGTRDIGQCTGGRQVCLEDGSNFGPCEDEVVPDVEVCDGVDNDCNAEVDDLPDGMCLCRPGTRRDCYTGPPDTEDVGLCEGGFQICDRDGMGYGRCEGEVTPGAEVCDGEDNSCNGLVDDAPGVGIDCSAGVGECRADGELVCDAESGRLVCDAVPGEPVDEVCDRADNDCNGNVDDVAGLGDRCTNGAGACARPGNRVCDFESGELACNAVPGEPAAEVCDGVDNDCDGDVDDGRLPGVGRACAEGQGECRAEGQTVCRGREGVQCDAVAGDPVEELCDGLDNDCNGAVDDDPRGVGDDCQVGVGECVRAAVQACIEGELTCAGQPGEPTRELCDDEDDDCDGEVDEGLVCDVFASCLRALVAGHGQSGIYRLAPDPDGAVFDVYCDQETDGGGWSLVASTLTSTLNDQGQNYYDDLVTLAPAGGPRRVERAAAARALLRSSLRVPRVGRGGGRAVRRGPLVLRHALVLGDHDRK